MKNIIKTIAIIAIFTSLPVAVFASIRPGTDDYLRQKLGITDEQLQTAVKTEERQAFDFTKGEKTLEDPQGDVLSRVGTTTSIQKPYGDITKVVAQKNENLKTWDVIVSLAGPVPELPPIAINCYVYVDRDGDNTNNEKAGVRGQMDAEYQVAYNPDEQEWQNRFRWYNIEEDFWAFPESKATHSKNDNTFTIHIPFDEITADGFPNWRVVMALGTTTDTQIDVAPGIGFPAPLGEKPYVDSRRNRFLMAEYLLIILAVLVVSVGAFIIKEKSGRKGSKESDSV
ncbi:MAG: hypothetical protein ABIH21_05770 [Patescibacteria group bacterium]